MMKVPCKYCHGRGGISVEGTSLAYRCPDCDGLGYTEHCDLCDEELGEDGYCHHCFAKCESCGVIFEKEEMQNNLCPDCMTPLSDPSDRSDKSDTINWEKITQ